MSLPKEYADLAAEVTAIKDIRQAVSTAFSMQQQKISDLQDKLNAGGVPAEVLASVQQDVADLHELNAQLRSGIPANTDPATDTATDPATETDPQP